MDATINFLSLYIKVNRIVRRIFGTDFALFAFLHSMFAYLNVKNILLLDWTISLVLFVNLIYSLVLFLNFYSLFWPQRTTQFFFHHDFIRIWWFVFIFSFSARLISYSHVCRRLFHPSRSPCDRRSRLSTLFVLMCHFHHALRRNSCPDSLLRSFYHSISFYATIVACLRCLERGRIWY